MSPLLLVTWELPGGASAAPCLLLIPAIRLPAAAGRHAPVYTVYLTKASVKANLATYVLPTYVYNAGSKYYIPDH